MILFFIKQKTAYEMRISAWSSDGVLFRSRQSGARSDVGACRKPPCGAQHQIVGRRETVRHRPFDGEGKRLPLIHGHDITVGDERESCLQFMIAVRTAAADMQREVELCRSGCAVPHWGDRAPSAGRSTLFPPRR